MEKRPIDAVVKVDFEQFWFNTTDYSEKQASTDGAIYSYKSGQKEIFIRLYRIENELISPFRAPFGGLEFSPQTDRKTLFDFIKEIIEDAKMDGITKIKISSYPECYDIAKIDLIDEALLHAGFNVKLTELNYHLPISKGDFENFIHDSEKRRLNKSIQAGFVCAIEANPDYDEIHHLISKCRNRKGYPLSMKVEEFRKMFLDFPERYLIFVVKDKNKTIAAAIGVKVRADILYNFLPADHEDYLSYSPMVLLNKGMYDYCRASGHAIYDLGIATAAGVRNEGLIKFKEHIGGELSHKYLYELTIDLDIVN